MNTAEFSTGTNSHVDMDPAPIPNRDGYHATPDGRVFSTRNHANGYEMYEMSPIVGPNGYLRVNICRDGLPPVLTFIHHLILETFSDEPRDGRQTRHIDGNPANNHIDNLRWGTAEENAADRAIHGHTRRGEDNNKAVLTDNQILDIRERFHNGESSDTLGLDFGVYGSTIRQIVTGKTWTHVGGPIHTGGPRTIYTLDQVRAFKNDVASKSDAETLKSVARRHNIGYQSACAIATGRIWSHV